jgi:hypothetical protein
MFPKIAQPNIEILPLSIVVGHAIVPIEKGAPKRLSHLCEQRQVDRIPSAAQHRAKSNHQQPLKIMQIGFAASGLVKTFPTRGRLSEGFFTGPGMGLLQKIAFRNLNPESASAGSTKLQRSFPATIPLYDCQPFYLRRSICSAVERTLFLAPTTNVCIQTGAAESLRLSFLKDRPG